MDQYKGIIRPQPTTSKMLSPDDSSQYKGVIRQGVVPDLSKPEVIAGQGEMDKQDLDVFSYQDFKENTQLREAARRFAINHLDYKPDEIDDDEAIDEAIEHFRALDTNELTAITDYGTLTALKTDNKQQELSDYKNLYQAYRAMPYFGEGSAAFSSAGNFAAAVGDYAYGIGTAPSTLLGLLIPGGGKVAGQATVAANKLLIGGLLSKVVTSPVHVAKYAAANPLKTAAGLEASGALFQNLAQQNVEEEIEIREGISAGEAALSTGLGAAGAFVPVGLKVGFTKFISKDTPKLIQEATKNAGELHRKGLQNAEDTLSKNAEEVVKLKKTLNPLDPERVARGQGVADQIAKEAGTLEPDFAVKFSKDKADKILAFAVDLLKKDGGLREGERITDAVARTIESLRAKGLEDTALSKELNSIKKKYNITDSDIAALYAADVSSAARTLGKSGFHAKVFRNVMNLANDNIFVMDKNVKDTFKKINEAVDAEDGRAFIYGVSGMEGSKADVIPQTKLGKFGKSVYEGLKESDSIRLALMVSQTATTVRNLASGNVRVGMDILTKTLDNGTRLAIDKNYRKAVGLRGATADIFSVAYGLANKHEAVLAEDFLYQGFQDKATRMFNSLKDLEPLPGQITTEMTPLRKFARQINALNTMSDNMFKRAAFIGEMKRSLNDMKAVHMKAGKVINDADYDLVEIMKKGTFNEVFGSTDEGKKFLDDAIEKALYFTYQRDAQNAVSKMMIDGVHKLPFLVSSFTPFPRFMANAMRFTYEYSPLYFIEGGKKSFGKEARNYEEVSKAAVGMGMYMAATAYRYQYGEGTQWYEMKLPDGTTFDARPFFPAAPFLFFGDLAARYLTQSESAQKVLGLDKQEPRIGYERGDFVSAIQALTGTQFRAGFGFYALDAMVQDATRGDFTRLVEFPREFFGNIVTTYGIPLTAGQDLYNTFLAPDEARVARETDTENFNLFMLRKILARVPGNYQIEDALQEQFGFEKARVYESPTKEAPIRRVTPITRQMYGILRREKATEVQKVFNDLKITNSRIYRKTRVYEADNYIRKFMGPYLEEHISSFIKTPLFKNADADSRRNMLLGKIDEYKDSILAQAKAHAGSLKGPEGSAFSKKGYKELPRFAREHADNVYAERMQADKRLQELDAQDMVDYDLLHFIGKSAESMGAEGLEAYLQSKGSN
jgi:hypothetical protein